MYGFRPIFILCSSTPKIKVNFFCNKQMNAVRFSLESVPLKLFGAKSRYATFLAKIYFTIFMAPISCSFCARCNLILYSSCFNLKLLRCFFWGKFVCFFHCLFYRTTLRLRVFFFSTVPKRLMLQFLCSFTKTVFPILECFCSLTEKLFQCGSVLFKPFAQNWPMATG